MKYKIETTSSKGGGLTVYREFQNLRELMDMISEGMDSSMTSITVYEDVGDDFDKILSTVQIANSKNHVLEYMRVGVLTYLNIGSIIFEHKDTYQSLF